MRYGLFASVLAIILAVPTPVEARSRVKFFFSVGSHGHHRFHQHHRFHHRPHFFTPRHHVRFHQPLHFHRPHHGAFHGRYVAPRVYSPYRGRYFNDHAYRRGLYGIDRGYYGPGIQQYHYDRRHFPSYHYDRREGYMRGQRY